MIDCEFFYNELIRNEISFFSGVPDSLLKSPCAFISGHALKNNHVIAANEGAAIALSCGYHLATGRIGLVYMQNSGQGNAINPLVSLADSEVYGIPLVLLIGWRGEPEVQDEPQHVKQGKITLKLLDALGIPYQVMPRTNSEVKKCLEHLVKIAAEKNTPVALVVRENSFKEYNLVERKNLPSELTRGEAIKVIMDKLCPLDIVVSTTGKTSRELYEYREQFKQGHSKDFLVTGAMGHASQIALAIALQRPERQVVCLDGDGAAIMHMGSMAIIGSQEAGNFRHIIINNGSHESVGGQPTAGMAISFVQIARGCGYKTSLEASTANELRGMVETLMTTAGPALLEVKVKTGSRADLGRPKNFKENKDSFMEFSSK